MIANSSYFTSEHFCMLLLFVMFELLSFFLCLQLGGAKVFQIGFSCLVIRIYFPKIGVDPSGNL